MRRPAEQRYAEEASRLQTVDCDPRPPGWQLSAKAVRRFIIGDEAFGVTRKFYGDDPLVDRAIVTLISAQGLMLVGEPGTEKSMLSQLLAAAVSGTSDLAVQVSSRADDLSAPSRRLSQLSGSIRARRNRDFSVHPSDMLSGLAGA